ncbi:39S ribosomal protein L44, mitochondrial-like [Panonychus citri]|uniref:39S ribosomal protein L44, mitochondrial-like n=1 Tax=Panonychus citri TaxID=50023 RepID=UPI002307D3C4|nr:39S ribosomal protein L44, mitochondrial-like [Panonychus citri]
MLSSRVLRSLSLLKPRVSSVNTFVERREIKTWLKNTLVEMKDRDRDFDLIPHKQRHRREWIDWNYDCEIFAFNARLGEKLPLDKLKGVFIDQSYVDEESRKNKELGLEGVGVEFESNRKLAEKGERIMKQFIASYLRFFLPRVPEEGILSILENLCSDKNLSHISGYIGCTELIMSPLVNPTDVMLSTAVKSLLGLLEETSGSQQCQKFIIDIILPYLNDKDLLEIWNPISPEIKVQQILQNDGLPQFEARLLRETGRNTIFSCYTVGLYVNKNLLGYGPGESIEIAKEMAAYDTLRRFFNLTPSQVLFKFGPPAHNLDYTSKLNQTNPPLKDWKLSDFNENIFDHNSKQQNQHQKPDTKIAASM